MVRSFMNVSKKGNQGVVDIYGEIINESWRLNGEMSALHFKDLISNLGDVEQIQVNVNSPGGDVYEGIAIHNMLKNHKAKVTVHIDGLAASIASVIAMAGDKIIMPNNAMLMIHNAMTMAFGNANDLRETADLLEKVTSTISNAYLDRTDKLDEQTLKALLDAETWLTADEALEYGLVDEVAGSQKLVACADTSSFKNFTKTPQHLMEVMTVENIDKEDLEERLEDLEKRVKDLESEDDEEETEDDDEVIENKTYYL